MDSIRTKPGACTLALSVVAIATGGMIYLWLRPGSIRFFSWMEWAGFSELVEALRKPVPQPPEIMADWMVYSLPNGLWAFSYALIIGRLWWGRKASMRYFWLSSIPLVGMGYELLQYLGAIPGTFCYQDLLMCATGVGMGFSLSIILARRGDG